MVTYILIILPTRSLLTRYRFTAHRERALSTANQSINQASVLRRKYNATLAGALGLRILNTMYSVFGA